MTTSRLSLGTSTPMKNNACKTPSNRIVAHLLAVGAVLLLASVATQAQVSFFTPPTYAGTGQLFVADFNGDGKPDLLSGDGTLQLATGKGTFTTGTPVAGGALAVADFNGDGKPDVLQQGTGTLLVLLGNGDGTFQKPISTPSGASLWAIAAGDLNGDGKADVVGVFNNSLIVYLSKGDGTFAAGVAYSLPNPPNWTVTSVILGDVNGDGKVDVTVIPTNGAQTQVVVFLGNGDGTLQSPKTSPGPVGAGFGLFPAVEGDFNDDGKPDLVISTGAYCDVCTGTWDIFLLLGNGDGTFQSPTAVIPWSGAGDLALAAADLNNDGKLDIVLENGVSSGQDVIFGETIAQIYMGNGEGTFSNANNYVLQFTLCYSCETAPPTSYLAIADFNLDGKPDIAAAGVVLLGNGNGTFQGIQLGAVQDFSGVTVTGDFAKNGKPGVAMLSNPQYFNNLYILSNNGAGALSLIHTYQLQQPGFAIVTTDLNGDGNLDLVVFQTDPISTTWGYSVLLGNGDGSFQSPIFYPQNVQANAYSYAVVVGDFNNDGKPDIAATLGGYSSLVVLLGNGDGTFAAPAYYYDDGAAFAASLVTADFNSDGKLDLAVGVPDPQNPTTAILFGNGDGTFQAAVFPSSLKGFAATLTADLRGNGKADLLGGAQVALGNGDGTFTVLPGYLQCGIGQVADINGDGIPDVIGPTGGCVQLGNGDGTFGSPVPIPNVRGIISVVDMNGDGRPDIVFPEGGAGVLLNNTTPDFAIGPASGSPTSQTVNAGQGAKFSLLVTPYGKFTGTVNLSCVITPKATPAPTCSLSSSSVQLSGSGRQPVTVTVGTTASVTSGMISYGGLPGGASPYLWTVALLASAMFFGRRLCGLAASATPIAVLVAAMLAGCGGGSSSSTPSTHTTPGTPAGTYTAAVTAASGSLQHTTTLTVVVQ